MPPEVRRARGPVPAWFCPPSEATLPKMVEQQPPFAPAERTGIDLLCPGFKMLQARISETQSPVEDGEGRYKPVHVGVKDEERLRAAFDVEAPDLAGVLVETQERVSTTAIGVVVLPEEQQGGVSERSAISPRPADARGSFRSPGSRRTPSSGPGLDAMGARNGAS